MSQRERDLLEAALAQVSVSLCLWCRTGSSHVRWSQTGRCWQVVVVHRPRCRACRSLPDRRRADELLHGLLVLYGVLVGDYGEDHLVLHTRVKLP